MFKSFFSKCLITFVLIILISFLMLSSIITYIVSSHVEEKNIDRLESSVVMLSDIFERNNIERIDVFIESSNVASFISLLGFDYDCEILITDFYGTVLLSTLIESEDGLPATRGELGTVITDDFDEVEESGETFFKYVGKLPGLFDERALVYGRDIKTGGEPRGYVFAFVSLEQEGQVINVVRSAFFNTSLWVLLAAVIAIYFITERLVHPLKNMTVAAKSFAKGDFSGRVLVEGSDEVAQLSVAFNNMAESLQSLETMRNSFLASVSHDLRTPMTTISGFIDGITSGAIPEEQHEYYLGVISTEIHRLSRLVNQLLDISRLESGDRKFHFTEFDITEVARLIIISFEKEIDKKRLDVDFITDEDSMAVYADKDAVYQVLYNLCHNAIKFSRESGRLIIKITRNALKKVIISVYDDGQVVSAEDAAHLFDRFYKTDKSRGLDKTGVGLGLYISKTIIDAHNEEIHLAPHTDGCEFWFTLKDADGTHKQSR